MPPRRRLTHLITAFPLLALLALPQLACAKRLAAPLPAHRFGELTLFEVDKRLRDHEPNFHLIDNNTREIFDKMHLPGARWIDYRHVTTGDLPADKEATLVFYCANEH